MMSKITFHGGVGSVTGANFLLETDGADGQSLKILIDCGMFQGSQVADERNRDPFPYSPASIDYLFITHAHLDHIGRIPRLVRQGFKGKIYSTPPTRDVAALSLVDSLGVLEKEARGSGQPLLYEESDVERMLTLWHTLDYRAPFTIGPLTVTLRDAGHILGSSMIEFKNQAGKKLLFTGDLGNAPTPLLPDNEVVSDLDYLVMESVYGDRVHEDRAVRQDHLEDIIENTLKAGGTLMIPAFSIERTQEIIYEIEKMMEAGRIPLVPVYLDSPLAIEVTAIYKKYESYWNKQAADENLRRDGLLNLPNLHKTKSTIESKAIANGPARKIIIAGSGMSNGGRIIHHERRFLPDEKSTLLLVGYQSAGSLGRQLQDGAKLVRILGQEVVVRARVEMISGYSAHKDSLGLLKFVEASGVKLKKVFVVMGESRSSLYLVQRIRDYLGRDAVAPNPGQTAVIDF